MKITIITACYNAEGTIRDAMASVAEQRLTLSGQSLELESIVVDGGSTDGTVAFIREFELEIRKERRTGFSFKWISERDKGMYDAINKGIRMASGEVIGILNADDVLDGDHIVAQIAQRFERSRSQVLGDKGIDCVYGKVRFVKGETACSQPQPSTPSCSLTSNLDLVRKAKTVRRCFAKLWRPWMLQWGYMPPHPGVFIRRECFEKWGGYVGDRKEYVIAADYELLIRFFRVHEMCAVYSGLCTTVMRTGGVSTKNVGARKLLNQEIIKANKANGYFCCWPMLIPKYAIKVWEIILPGLGFTG